MYNISQKNSNFTKYSSSYYLPNATSLLKALWELDQKQKSSIQEREESIETDVQDSRLKNWEKWLKVHEEQAKHLADTLNRPSQCLLMNTECKRYVNEQKWLIEKCNEYVISDYYRGHPDFWKVPGRRNFDRTKPDAPLPQQDYIDIPNGILQAQGITERCFPTLKEKWDNSIFVKSKLHELKDKIRVIETHRPDTNLMVTGEKILPPPEKNGEDKTLLDFSSVDIYNGESVDNNEQDTVFKCDLTDEAPVVLQLGGIMLESKNNSAEKTADPLVWRVVFKECKVNENYEQTLDIINLSTSSVRYDWKSKLPPQFNHCFPFKLIRKFVPRFNFNKSNNVLLSHEKRQFKFWFKSSVPGIFKEQWELQTDPIFNEDRPLIITLEGFVTGVYNTSHIDSISKYIKSQIISTKVRNTVDEILIRTKYDPICEQLNYNTKFSEEEIFLHNNPALYYDSNSVTILKYLNKKISDEAWDYSVKNLRDKLLNRKIEDHADKQESIRIFYDTLHKLQQPSIQTTLSNRRYMAVYRILSIFLESMYSESIYLKKCFNMDETLSISSITESRGTNKLQKHSRKRDQQILTMNTQKTSRRHSLKDATNLIDKASESKYSGVFSITGNEFSGQKSLSNLEMENQFRKQKYNDIFYIRTYTLLSKTVDKIFVILSSIELHEDPTICTLLQRDV